jgi:hypothetical protein
MSRVVAAMAIALAIFAIALAPSSAKVLKARWDRRGRMADLDLPIMAPADCTEPWSLGSLGCWARADETPPETSAADPYWTACRRPPTSDLGLCRHHLATIFPPEVRTHAPHA